MSDQPLDDPAALVARARERVTSLSVGTLHPDGDLDLGLPPDRVLQIGSVTKLFTGLLLALEVMAGRLALDQPVADLLPGDVRLPDASITLGELATHTSGLPRLPPGMLRRALRRDSDPYGDLDAPALHAALARTRVHRRGRPAYSNLGAGLLGHALCLHAGLSYGDLVLDRIAGPLGMRDTVTDLTPEQRERTVPGEGRRGERTTAWTFDALAGAGALWSTVADLRIFLRAHLGAPGADPVLAAAMQVALEPRVAHLRTRHGLGWIWLMGETDDQRLAWHNGGTAGYRSYVALHPDTRAGVVVLGATPRPVDPLGLALVRSIGAVG